MHRASFVKALTCAACAAPLLRPAPARGAGIDEIALGREAFGELRDGGEILFDSPYYEHLNEVGQIIAATVGNSYPVPLRYYIVRGDSANAFAVPGGNIYVNEPLLKLTRNRDELASVLAHESGHMVAHHLADRIAKSRTIGTVGTIASVAAQVLLGPLASIAANTALNAGAAATDANVSRHIEAQADELGAEIMARSGQFNPYGMIWMFDIMRKTYGSSGAKWLLDHPLDSERISDLRNYFARKPEVFGKFTDTRRGDEFFW